MTRSIHFTVLYIKMPQVCCTLVKVCFSCPDVCFCLLIFQACKYDFYPGVRSAMRAASQLPGKGPTDVDDATAPAC